VSSLQYDIIPGMNTNKISYNKYVAEIIGALILVMVVALSGAGLSAIIFVGLAYAFVVYLFGDISGAHANPAFTIAALTMKKIKWQDAILYICAQLIGAGLGLIILKNIGFTFMDIKSIESLTLSKLFFAEVIGSAVFAMAFAASLHGKTTKSNNGLILGFGLFFGLLFANIITQGVGILNPAIAIGVSVLNWATILGPIAGALIGAWLYRFTVLGNLCGCNSTCDSSCFCGFCHRGSKNNVEEPVVIESVVFVDSADLENLDRSSN